jgi:Zn-dependent M28 family amino/carboxypeptidase
MWGSLIGIAAILLVMVIAAFVLYQAVVGVKPRVDRPGAATVDRAPLDDLERRLMSHVTHLALTIGPRHLDRPEALEAAAVYIEEQLRACGLDVEHESYQVRSAAGELRTARNLIAELPGEESASDAPATIVLIGAHYDTVPDCPGANDNGTGVAALIEIARALTGGGERPTNTLRFVAFVNEEPPYFNEGTMGSQHHARQARQRGDDIIAMLSLETIGCYSDVPGSQQYPFPFDRFYPDTGNFLTVVGNLGSRSLVTQVMRHFMAACDFPIEGAAAPASVPGVGWSDHRSFWQQGYRAIMLTDTAPFRYAEYHEPDDLPDRIHPRAFARAVDGIVAVARGLARDE